MTAPKTVPITTGTTKKLSGNGRRGDLDGEGASILSTHLSVAPVFRGCGGRMVQGHRLVTLPSTQRHRSPFLSALSDFHGFRKSWQLGDIRRDPPCFVFGKQFRRRSPSPFVLIIEVSELLSVGVAHDVVVRLQLGRPRRREAAVTGCVGFRKRMAF